MILAAEVSDSVEQVQGSWPVLLGLMAVVGLLLWVMGRKLARPAVATCGLFLGASTALIISMQVWSDPEELRQRSHMLLIWVAVGAVAGCLIAWLLYRLWMGVSLAVLLALVAPAAFVVWQGTTLPDQQTTDQPDAAAVEKKAADKQPDIPINQFGPSDIADSIDISGQDLENARQTILDLLKRAYDYERAHLEEWWQQQGESGHQPMYITMAAAAVIGLLIGLLLPNVSASFQTSLVGAMMVLAGARGLLAIYAEAQIKWLPTTPRENLVTLGLITLLGMGLQWTFWRKKADK